MASPNHKYYCHACPIYYNMEYPDNLMNGIFWVIKYRRNSNLKKKKIIKFLKNEQYQRLSQIQYQPDKILLDIGTLKVISR